MYLCIPQQILKCYSKFSRQITRCLMQYQACHKKSNESAYTMYMYVEMSKHLHACK